MEHSKFPSYCIDSRIPQTKKLLNPQFRVFPQCGLFGACAISGTCTNNTNNNSTNGLATTTTTTDDNNIFSTSTRCKYGIDIHKDAFENSSKFRSVSVTLPYTDPVTTDDSVSAAENGERWKWKGSCHPHQMMIESRIKSIEKTVHEQVAHLYNCKTDITYPVMLEVAEESLALSRKNVEYNPYSALSKTNRVTNRIRSSDNILMSERQKLARIRIMMKDDDWTDVPTNIISNFLEESLRMQKTDNSLEKARGSVGCIATFDISNTHLLIYAYGFNLHILKIQGVLFPDISGSACDVGIPLISDSLFETNFDLLSRIDVITVSKFGYICIISQHTLTQFLVGFDASTGKISVQYVSAISMRDKPVSCEPSPYIRGETLILTESSQIYLWNIHNSVECVQQEPHTDAPLRCQFAAHPRQLVTCSSQRVDLLTLSRQKGTSRNPILSLPHTQVTEDEIIISVQRHPTNKFHYLITTTTSLMLVDSRFPENLLLQWNTMLLEPAKFMDIKNIKMQPESHTVMVTLSSCTKHTETFCYLYRCYGDGHPPAKVCPPWRVCSIRSWFDLCNTDKNFDIFRTRLIEEYLEQPLVGVTSVANEDNSFMIFQVLQTGDVYCQLYLEALKTDSPDNDSQRLLSTINHSPGPWADKVQLQPHVKLHCRNWLEKLAACVLDNSDDENDGSMAVSGTGGPRTCEDVLEVTQSILSCLLCNPVLNLNIETESEDDDPLCPSCGHTRSYGHALLSLQLTNPVLTRHSVHGDHDDVIDDDADDMRVMLSHAEDPLSVKLWNDWYGEPSTFEQIRSELGSPMISSTPMYQLGSRLKHLLDIQDSPFQPRQQDQTPTTTTGIDQSIIDSNIHPILDFQIMNESTTVESSPPRVRPTITPRKFAVARKRRSAMGF